VTTLNHYALTEFRKNDFRETDQRIVNNVYRATGLILNSECTNPLLFGLI